MHACNPGLREVEPKPAWAATSDPFKTNQRNFKNRTQESSSVVEHCLACIKSWVYCPALGNKSTNEEGPVQDSHSMSYAAGWLCSPKCLNQNTNTGTSSITMLSLFPCYHIQIFDNILHLISDLPESSASLCLHMWSMSKHEPTEATVASQSYRTWLTVASTSPRHHHFFIWLEQRHAGPSAGKGPVWPAASAVLDSYTD